MKNLSPFESSLHILILVTCGLFTLIGCNSDYGIGPGGASPVSSSSLPSAAPSTTSQPAATAPVSSATPAPCSTGTFGSQCTGTPPIGPSVPQGAHAFLYQLTPTLDPVKGYAANVGAYAGIKVTGSMNLLNSTSLLPNIDLYATQINVPLQLWTNGFPGFPNLQEWFGLCYDGTWTVPNSGSYTIVTAVDDAIAIYIDGQLLGENDDGNVHSTIQTSNNSSPYNPNPVAFPAVTLSAGPHNVEIMYYQGWPYHLQSMVWVLPPGTPFTAGATYSDSESMQLTNPVGGMMSCPH